MKNLAGLGRYFFGVAVVGSGILQLAWRDFVRLVPRLPTWIPGQPIWACLAGVVLIAIGLAIITGKKGRAAVTLLAILIFLVLALLAVPQALKNPMAGFMWTSPCKTLALLGGAILLTGILREKDPREPAVEKLARLAAIFLGIFLLVGGIQHFVYADFVVKMVPPWMPGLRFWTYFTGMALIAGGLGLMIPKTTRCAATLAGIMIFLWVPLVHLPRAYADPHHPGEIAGLFEALALSGVAFLVAGSAKTKPKNA